MFESIRAWLRSKNLAYHYDISNHFYELILGETMAYSSGYIKSPNDTLNELQKNNFALICEKLKIGQGDNLLDLGCGWGGFLLYVAQHYQIPVTGITLNQSHHDYVLSKAQKLGLQKLVTVRKADILKDDLTGSYSKITSMEMYEHVRIKNLPKYFGIIHRLLKPQGRFFIQSIVAGNSSKRRLGGHKFMDRYIFPGGQVPTYPVLKKILMGFDWKVDSIENITESYVPTLGYWLKNLQENSQACIQASSERIYRLWLLYLAGSLVGMEEHTVEDYQTVMDKS